MVTNWNVLFQSCFLTMSLVYDMMEWMDKHESYIGRKLKYVRDVMFCGLVVPLTLFISSMFWTVYWIDRELVFPEIYDQLVPWWFNHCVHTNILIVLGVETLLQARRYPTNRKIELWLNGIAGVSYAIVYYSIYFLAHRWLYNVFAIMTWWQVCLYQILIWASTFVFYFIQFPINRIFHKEPQEIQEEKTEVQISEKKTDNNGLSSDSWNLKYRSKGLVEHSSL
ncbi:androgen-dependent TFPI-regulating protein-like isoform X3 [Anticarsia gemmatalis]|uniref:androgen-dependent TFPI-regulating protein-like isoform X3 n=1 Tax=Anticarsia gemmatalis TaxID=129554 RepID=UPI003F760476